MKLSTFLVAIKKITSSKPRSIFADEELEQAANLILESEGVINPIIIRRTGLQTYEVIDGDFEYYAAARAREIDPRKGEMIGVFIIESENEELLTKQIELFRNKKTVVQSQIDLDSSDIESRLTNFELRIEKKLNDLIEKVSNKQKLEIENKELKNNLANKIEPLEIFNKLQVAKLAFRLKSAGLSEKIAAKIADSIEKERNKKEFESLEDIVNRVKISSGKRQVKGISSERMIKIVDSWSRTLFI
ncbi:DUF655 domain-containing protein [Calothrix sp. NIES-2098]|uniref:DUF655 domain-containing protein n=1 Tax=Calothrix sp. NIES-2098 TaxID=1954171 RepID=UPI000B5EFD8D|nr:hypothetical protein NIES2098_28610 [Calothrix sp. NIES-2098]